MAAPTLITLGQWQFLVNVEATRAAYAERLQGGPEECGCLHCRNFAAARQRVYTPDVTTLLAQFGILPIREAEVYHYCELQPGIHDYGGVLHVVGKIVSRPDVEGDPAASARALQWEPVTFTFRVAFKSDVDLVPDCFPKQGLFQIEISVEVPWVLDEPCGGA